MSLQVICNKKSEWIDDNTGLPLSDSTPEFGEKCTVISIHGNFYWLDGYTYLFSTKHFVSADKGVKILK